METITQSQLARLLASRSGAEPIGFTAFVDALKRKASDLVFSLCSMGERYPCPFVAIRKLSRVRPFAGTSYSGAVNRQRTREGSLADFVASSARYDHVGGHLVAYRGTGNLCLAVQFNVSAIRQQTARPVYLAKRSMSAPWSVVPHASVAPWTDDNSVANARATQDLTSPILWRTYGLANIPFCTIGGQAYRVRA